MITLLLTASMCHALSFTLHHSAKEQADDKEVKEFENMAHVAHKEKQDTLEKELAKAESLLIGLGNHKKAYEKSHNPRQAARTQSRIDRLHSAISTIKGTLAKLNKTSHGKHHAAPSVSKPAALSTSTSSMASASSSVTSLTSPLSAAPADSQKAIHTELEAKMGKKQRNRKR